MIRKIRVIIITQEGKIKEIDPFYNVFYNWTVDRVLEFVEMVYKPVKIYYNVRMIKANKFERMFSVWSI